MKFAQNQSNADAAPSTWCVEDEQLEMFTFGRIDNDAVRAAIHVHLLVCARCRDRLAWHRYVKNALDIWHQP